MMILAALAAAVPPAAAAEAGTVKSTITSVVVYPDRAAVTREAVLDLEKGPASVSIAGLPASLDPDSLRASGQGSAAVRILGLEAAVDFTDASLLPEVKELEASIESQAAVTTGIADRIAVLDAQEKFLTSIDPSSLEWKTDGTGQARTDLSTWKKALDFIGTELQSVRSARLDLRRKLQAEQARLDALKKKLEATKPANARQARRVTVLLEAAGPGRFRLELTYVVRNARWYPLYTMRAVPDSGRVEFNSTGVIIQKTGEDWADVKAVLSTASPAAGASPSPLDPWYVDILSRVLPKQARYSPNADKAVGGVMAEAAPSEAPIPVEAEAETAAVAESGLHLNFEIKARLNVPSDGAPHRVPIDGRSLDASFDYLSMPKTGEAAYLRGRLKNTLPYPLLPGQADIFILQDFVGSFGLGFLAAGDDLDLFFGEDPQIKVSREQVKRDRSQGGLIGKVERIRYGYRITVRNLRDRGVLMELRDQLPVSRNEKVTVKDVEITPQPSTRDEQGILNWKLDLGPGEKKELLIEFTLEYPRGAEITGIR